MVSNDLIKVICLSLFVLIMKKYYKNINFFLHIQVFFYQGDTFGSNVHEQILKKLKGTVSVISSDPPMQRW